MTDKSLDAVSVELAELIADYRHGEVAKPTAKHVLTWLDQFDEDTGRKTIFLNELNHVLKKTYVNKTDATGFFRGLVRESKIAGEKPCSFWPQLNILDVQKGGNSQAE